MTWQDAIGAIEREVSSEDIWDASVGDSTIQGYMRDFLHVALLSVAQDLPLSRLPASQTSDLTFAAEGAIQTTTLPDDLFGSRSDLGIVQLMLNGEPRNLSEQVPLSTLSSLVSNSYVQAALFYLDETIKQVYAINIDSQSQSSVRYVAKPSKPDTGNLGSADISFSEEIIRSAVSVVSSHLLAVPAGAINEMKVHQLLGKMYLGATEATGTPNQQ